MILKLCLQPGCETLVRPGQRCPNPYCPRSKRLPSKSTQPRPTARETARRRATVQAWVAEHGWWCPGYGVPAHLSTDLTADHPVPTSLGGDVDQPLQVLCRGCNARKGGRNRLRFPHKGGM